MIADFLDSLIPKSLSVFRPRNAVLENPNYSLSDPAAYEFLAGGSLSDSGQRINHETALTLAPLWQAVDMVSGDASSIPTDLYRKLPNDDREVAEDHKARFLIAGEWNDETPAFEGWRRAFAHALLWGNGYIYIDRNSRFGPPNALYNLLPDRTTPVRTNSGELAYVTEVDGSPEPLFKEEVMHIKGLSLVNGKGLDSVFYARNCIGLALAAEGYSSKFFANGAQAAGIVTVPMGMKETAIQKIEEGFRKRTSKDNWFKFMIVRDGAKFEQATIDAQKAQTHELRVDEVHDVCRFTKLPPFKLGIPGSVSYNSTEQGQLLYLSSCLNHWLIARKTEATMKLLTLAERKSGEVYIGHNTLEWLELDAKTFNEILEIQRRNEVINANEWRVAIHRNRRTDPGGDEYTNPNVKTAVAGSAAAGGGASDPNDPDDPNPKKTKKLPQPVDPPAPAAPPKPSKKAHVELLAEAVNRVARRVVFDAIATAKKPGKFVVWLDNGALEHRKVFDDSLRFPVAAYCSVFGGEPAAVLCDLSGRFFLAALDAFRPLIEPPNKADDLDINVTAACLNFEATIADQLLTFTRAEAA